MNGGAPIAGCFFFHGKTIYKWMRTGSSHILGTPHIAIGKPLI
jgi:hypothetical protein